MFQLARCKKFQTIHFDNFFLVTFILTINTKFFFFLEINSNISLSFLFLRKHFLKFVIFSIFFNEMEASIFSLTIREVYLKKRMTQMRS